MSTEENKALVRRLIDEVVSQYKLEVLDEITGTVDGASENPWDGFRETQVGARAVFPDWRESVEQLVAEDDWVAVRGTVEGTHTGRDYQGIPATGKRMKVSVAQIFRINRGKLVGGWFTANMFSLFEQLGGISQADLLRETNKALIRRWIAGRNANDVEAALQCWSPERREWLRNAFGNFSRGFPDIHLEIEDLVAERNEVLMRCLLTGTHLGVWSGVEPTGRKVEWRFVDTYTIVDGKIASLLRVAPDLKAILTA